MFEATNITNMSTSPLSLANVKPQSQENALAKNNSCSYKTASTFNSSTGTPFQTDDAQDAGLFDFCNVLEYAPMPEICQLESVFDKSETMLKQSKKIQKEKAQNSKAKEKKSSESPQKKIVSAKKDAWRADEDAQLIELYAQYGQKWAKIAGIMKSRSGKQVRDRYLNMLRPDIRQDEWTPEEEELFTTLIEQFPNKWCKIASQLPGRTENQVKNKFYWERRKKSDTPVKKSKRRVPKQSSSTLESEASESQQSVEEVQFKVIDEPYYDVIPDSVETSSYVEPVDDFFRLEAASLYDYSSSDEILFENFRELNWTPF